MSESSGWLRPMVAAVAVVLIVTVGCGSSDEARTTAAPASCNPARPAPTGMSGYAFEFNGLEIPYFVAVPSGYDQTSRHQLRLILPGGSGQAATAAAAWEPNLPMTDAVVAIADIRGAHRDVDAIRALTTTLTEDYCVDSRTVGVIGFSASGPFTARLASASEDLIAAMVVGIGSFDPPPNADRAVPLLAWTGNSDQRSASRSVDAWVEVNGCDPEPIGNRISDRATTFTYQGCDAPIEYHVFAEMGHQIPSHRCQGSSFCYETPTFDLFESAADFLEANPLPTGP